MFSSTRTDSAVPSGRRTFHAAATELFINVKSYRFPIAIFVISRLVILIGFFLAASIFVRDQPVADVFHQLWLRWDGGWYLHIAAQGYQYTPDVQSSVAFFPLLPILIRLLATWIDPVTAGLVVVNVSVAAAYVLLYALVRLEFPDDQRIARRTLLYIAFFPTAIFSLLIYTEGIYLLLAVTVFYCARRQMWSLSIAAAILGTLVRAPGVLLALVVALEWARAHGFTLRTMARRDAWGSLFGGIRRSPLTVVAIVIIPLGLISYMIYLNAAYGEPFAFLQAQVNWGRSLSTPFTHSLSDIQGFFSAITSGQQVSIESLFNVPALVLALVVSVVVWWRLGTTYGLFTLASILIPISTSMTSFVRYVGVIFPLYVVLALWGKRSVVHQIIFSLFCTLLGIVLVIYVSGIFLA